MSGYSLIEEIKKKKNLDNDNQVAKLVNIKRQLINGYKKQGKKPSADVILELMIAGEFSAEEAKILLSKNNESGYTSVSLIFMTAICSTLILIGKFYFIALFIHYAK